MFVVLLVIIFLFAFLLLIPEGKEYRIKRIELKKERIEYEKYDNLHTQTLEKLKTLQSQNRHTIVAFASIFNPQRFIKQHKKYFTTLTLSELKKVANKDEFAVYEVNTTSSIHSPKNFYEFLDAVNKSDYIIGVNFPINFQREGEMIRSSFTMKVYANNRDTNASTSPSKAK
jgi:hypothetical protein